MFSSNSLIFFHAIGINYSRVLLCGEPPLNALRIFEVAARTSSYAQAAAELGLTHGAVSRQISGLESWLGQRLF